MLQSYLHYPKRSPFLQFILAFVVTCAALTAVFWIYYFSKTAAFVDQKLRHPSWAVPSTIYAEAPEIYPGKPLSADWLTRYLQNLGYEKTRRSVPRDLEFSLGRTGIAFHSSASTFPVFVNFNAKGIDRLTNLNDGTRLQQYHLDPAPISNLYGAKWEKRTVIKYEEIPSYLIEAVVAIEDHRFYQHHGVDWLSISRAAWNNFKKRGLVEGGSTITQQYVKNSYLSPQRSIQRKLNEAMMALLIEKKLDKKHIMELYLNEIYLGQKGAIGIHGVEEASRMYFDKDIRHISVPEAALLAGMIQAPQRYNPYQHIEAAIERRNTVLLAMKNNEIISWEQYKQYIQMPLVVHSVKPEIKKAPYFVRLVNKDLQSKYGSEEIQRGNFQIYTTLDIDMQRQAEEVLTNGLARIDRMRSSQMKKPVQGCLIAADPVTGAVKAYVGGRKYSQSQYDRITQAWRQPGSAFKPLVYASAMEWAVDSYNHYFTPATLLPDEPWSWQYGDRIWEPVNYDRTYHGVVTSRRALAESMNVATARLAQEVGMARITSLARAFGFANAKPYPSLALGAINITPWELLQGYTVFANGGKKTSLNVIRKIVDSYGHPKMEQPSPARRVLSAQTAFLITDMLRSVITSGTGASVRRLGFVRPAAGKTGTTDDFRDAWFVGYTPDLICLIWVGYDDNTPLRLNAAEAAAPIWAEFMKRATQYMPVREFTVPQGIVSRLIDPTTGKLATETCPEAIREVFIQGTEPIDYCNHYYDYFTGQYYTMPAGSGWVTIGNDEIQFNQQTNRYEYHNNGDSTYPSPEGEGYPDQAEEFTDDQTYQQDSNSASDEDQYNLEDYPTEDEGNYDDQYSSQQDEYSSDDEQDQQVEQEEQEPQHLYFAPEPNHRKHVEQVPPSSSETSDENEDEEN